jgi:hypothetical protein
MKKVFYWYDEPVADVIIEPAEPVTPQTEITEPVVEDVTEPVTVDIDEMVKNARTKLDTLKNTLDKDPSAILDSILADNKKPVTPVATVIDNGFEITDFKNIGLNDDQQKAVATHIASLISKKDSEIANLNASVSKLNDSLNVKNEDETSIVKKIESAYKTNVTALATQVQDFETIVTNLTEQIKIKDSIIAKNNDQTYLTQELEKNPHMAEVVKMLKISTKEEYMKIKTPELEAREKLVFESKEKEAKHINSKNIMRTVNGVKANINSPEQSSKEVNTKFDYLNKFMTPTK